ncbi:MAG: prepilin-type N-terminal cleavage/methylation domain-containing protein [bacterium]|nr:prepilin-type N-terminal cleavage/methylation domain-containing protein [bacterium]
MGKTGAIIPRRGHEWIRFAGFTLVELVIVLVVAAILVLAITPLMKVNLNAYVTVQKGKKDLDMARIGFGRMVSEMKRIQNANDVLILGANQVQFEPAFYRNGDWYSHVIQYTYDPAAQIITRNVMTGDMLEYPLVKDVSAFTITYLDRNGTAVTTSKDIWRIRLNMTVGTGSGAVTYTQDIHPKIIPYVNG